MSYKNDKKNGNGNHKQEKGDRPWIAAYLAMGEDGKIRTETRNGKTYYQDQILAVWKSPGKFGAMLRGILGLDRDTAMRVSLRPLYGIFEQIVEEDGDGKKTYKDGRELLGTVQILKKDDKEFPVVRLLSQASDDSGLVEVVPAVGFVNGDVPGSDEDSGTATSTATPTGKESKAPAPRVNFKATARA